MSLLSQNGIGLEVVTAKGAVVHGHRTIASRLRQRVWEPLLGSLRRYGVGGVGFRARVSGGLEGSRADLWVPSTLTQLTPSLHRLRL